MNRETVNAVLRFLTATTIPTLDLTGGAPELNPHFDYLVESARHLKRHVMDRCNLTVIFEPGKPICRNFSNATPSNSFARCLATPRKMSIANVAKGLLT